jgi:hypothetical protein
MKARNANFLLAAAGPGDFESRLHPHERVHLQAEGLLDARAISPDESALLFSKLDKAGRET